MIHTTEPISPLRQRLIEDMRMRKLSAKTQTQYIRWVKGLAEFLERSPHRATAEDLRRFQLHLVETGVGSPSLNMAVTALRFFFTVTLGRAEVMAQMSHVYEPRKLPVVLSPEEVSRLLSSAPGLKYQAALSVAYGAGLRASEVVALKVDDIDSTRMALRVEQGKGRKDRYAMLSPSLLTLLRSWWREANAHGKMLPHGWLFPGQDPLDPMSTRQLNRPIRHNPGCGIPSPPICWSTRRTFASSRCCLGTRSWTISRPELCPVTPAPGDYQ
jgi:integrase/recombinase XerD